MLITIPTEWWEQQCTRYELLSLGKVKNYSQESNEKKERQWRRKKYLIIHFCAANEDFASHLFFFDEGYKGGSLYLNWLPGPGIDIGLRV